MLFNNINWVEIKFFWEFSHTLANGTYLGKK